MRVPIIALRVPIIAIRVPIIAIRVYIVARSRAAQGWHDSPRSPLVACGTGGRRLSFDERRLFAPIVACGQAAAG